MPELTAHSISAPHPLPPSLYAAPPDDLSVPPVPPAAPSPPEPSTPQNGLQLAAVPAVIDPATWEDFAVFRETFLMYLTPPGYAAALRMVGEMLFTIILENYDPWPGWPESSTRTELSAAVADLRHLEGFLGAVGREHSVSSLARADERLSRFAARQAEEVARIAHRIEAELAKWAPSPTEESSGEAAGEWAPPAAASTPSRISPPGGSSPRSPSGSPAWRWPPSWRSWINWQETDPERVLMGAPDQGKVQALLRLYEKLTRT